MEKLLWVRHIHSFTLDFNLTLLMRRRLKETRQLRKSGEVFNDIQLVSARTGIQLTPDPLQLMTEERMQSSSFCTGFSPLPLTQLPSPQIHSSPSLFCALRGGPLGTASSGLTCPLATSQIWPIGGTGRKVKGCGEVRSGCIFSTPFPLQYHVFDRSYVPSWLQPLLGRPLSTGSSSRRAPVILFPSLGPGEVMAYCCSQFLGVSPSLVCSLNPGHK